MLSRVNCKNDIDLVLLFLLLTSGTFSMFRSYLTQSSSSNSNRLHITVVYEVKNTRNNFSWFAKLLDSLEADENTGTSDLKAIFLHSQYPFILFHYHQTSLVQSICIVKNLELCFLSLEMQYGSLRMNGVTDMGKIEDVLKEM